MDDIKTDNETVRMIRAEVAAFRRSKNNLPTNTVQATEKLMAKAFHQDEITLRRDAFSAYAGIDKTAILANYELLHGVNYIDNLENAEAHPIDARCIIAIFRGVEICFHNMAALADRIAEDVRLDRIGEVAIKISWMNHFNDSLYRFSQILAQTDTGKLAGDFLSIEASEIFQSFSEKIAVMHGVLQSTAAETASDIFAKDIDDPRRFTFFHAFVNTNYETIWRSILCQVRLPGIFCQLGENSQDFYRRIIQTDDVRDAVACVDLKHVTYLMQFRAFHQISEILVGLVNELIVETIVALTNISQSSFDNEVRSLGLCNKLLRIVTDNIKPIVRTLSPKAYLAIRPSLGITSGSHSQNLRKGLFLTIYPLLVRSFRLRVVDFDEVAVRDDRVVLDRAQHMLRGDNHPQLAKLMPEVVNVYQSVRLWRDEHIQFVKTQIGLSHGEDSPTASISGAENAAQSAHKFRMTHKNDPIGPLHEAVLGRPPPPVFEIVHAGFFDEYMSAFTADAVHQQYADVQQRAQRRRNLRAQPLA